jgi:peptidoglycan/LPS O-acetylase OafA/YrhL
VIATFSVLPLAADGPLYHQFLEIMSKPCIDEWWKTLLYIANLWDKTWVCVAHAWYLSNDMQFYVISPLFILPIFYKPVLGCLWTVVGVLLSIFASLYVFFSNSMWGSLVGQHFTPEHWQEFAGNFELYYVKPWCRIGPYLIGILLGFIFYHSEVRICSITDLQTFRIV